MQFSILVSSIRSGFLRYYRGKVGGLDNASNISLLPKQYTTLALQCMSRYLLPQLHCFYGSTPQDRIDLLRCKNEARLYTALPANLHPSDFVILHIQQPPTVQAQRARPVPRHALAYLVYAMLATPHYLMLVSYTIHNSIFAHLSNNTHRPSPSLRPCPCHPPHSSPTPLSRLPRISRFVPHRQHPAP